ncbi:hypothetical protein [Gemmata sp.]|uniref:hypothetical protein n=1 Tax=Gemmata sp. TaxID=1914242 RepID=UPI003F717116
MQITVYLRSYAVAGSPTSVSFGPDHARQRHTFTVDGQVHEAAHAVRSVVVPDGARLDTVDGVLRWRDGTGTNSSTAQEVFELARAGDRGFSLGTV